ncbi:hypothetical protein R1flu_002747 [Riccia fluitans]|uniref:DUF4246 domain-containing protein n=1 Tax=Riccia fluitans TaxID=41844 RepID=A0ABD1Y703_9MARC
MVLYALERVTTVNSLSLDRLEAITGTRQGSEMDSEGGSSNKSGDQTALAQEQRPELTKGSPMEALKRAIRRKKKWEEKVNDETICKKYKTEAVNQLGIAPNIVDTAMKELQVEARHILAKPVSASSSVFPPLRVTDLQEIKAEVSAIKDKIPDMMVEGLEEEGNEVWYVDKVVPNKLKGLLMSRLDAIANSKDKDFHPGSNDQIQDLIHPSMFPYIEDMSPINPRVTVPPKSEMAMYRRQYEDSTYQWLPSEFSIDSQGAVKIQSYINNLEEAPNQDLYRAIELVFELFLPMLEKLLSSDEENEQLRDRNLQVIVKAANYAIQPKGKVYEGSWHVEGMSHEHICATGIYYYSTSEFLQDAGLEFRRERDPESDYPSVLEYNMGMEEELGDDFPDMEGLQHNVMLGAVPTVEDRLLIFPNSHQHKVSGVTNTSEFQFGTRKILVFFVVDPSKEIVSTRHIPEQQWERLKPKQLLVMSLVANRVTGPRKRFPFALIDEIVSRAKVGLTTKEARWHRLELMKERKYKIDEDNQGWEREYTLCEH